MAPAVIETGEDLHSPRRAHRAILSPHSHFSSLSLPPVHKAAQARHQGAWRRGGPCAPAACALVGRGGTERRGGDKSRRAQRPTRPFSSHPPPPFLSPPSLPRTRSAASPSGPTGSRAWTSTRRSPGKEEERENRGKRGVPLSLHPSIPRPLHPQPHHHPSLCYLSLARTLGSWSTFTTAPSASTPRPTAPCSSRGR